MDCQWLDSHCHFDFKVFDEDRERHWQDLTDFGCAGLVIPGVMASTWDNLILLCKHKPWGYALGLHPYFSPDHKKGDLQLLEQYCERLLLANNDNHLIAIGEFGLDFYLEDCDVNEQKKYCQQQLLLAKTLGLPVILHIRKAYDELASMTRRLGFNNGGVIHAFSGSLQQGESLIKLGYKLGIGGAISHPRATKLRSTVSQLPIEGLVLETDSPDMVPAFWKGANSPLSLLLLGQIVASLHQGSLTDVISASNANLLAVFPRLKHIVHLA